MIPRYITNLIHEKKNCKTMACLTCSANMHYLAGILWATKEELEFLKEERFNGTDYKNRIIKCEKIIKLIEEVLE